MSNKKRVLGVGRYSDPPDSSKPFYVQLVWFEDHKPIEQDMSQKDFLKMVNSIISENEIEIAVGIK